MLLAALVVVLAPATRASADAAQEGPAALEDRQPSSDAPASGDTSSRHAVYAELLGKTGLYGLGYEYQPAPWLHLGTSISVWNASGATLLAAAPYLGVGARLRGDHRWFAHLGSSIVHHREPAVAGWDGLSETGIGGQLAAGYELRRTRYFVRASAIVSFGDGGWVPWLGLAAGIRL